MLLLLHHVLVHFLAVFCSTRFSRVSLSVYGQRPRLSRPDANFYSWPRFPSYLPFPRLTHASLRHFSSSKPSSSRASTCFLFPPPRAGTLHLLEASHTGRENKTRVTELPGDTAVPGMQRVGGQLDEAWVAAGS